MDKDYLLQMNKTEKEFSSVYRNAASCFNLSECAMWVLYYIVLMDNKTTQQNLHEVMLFPKQTINSAVVSLERKGIISMRMIPGTKNLKEIILTESGISLAEHTVMKMIRAELKAFGRMNEADRKLYVDLHKDILKNIKEEFRKEGIGYEQKQR